MEGMTHITTISRHRPCQRTIVLEVLETRNLVAERTRTETGVIKTGERGARNEIETGFVKIEIGTKVGIGSGIGIVTGTERGTETGTETEIEMESGIVGTGSGVKSARVADALVVVTTVAAVEAAALCLLRQNAHESTIGGGIQGVHRLLRGLGLSLSARTVVGSGLIRRLAMVRCPKSS